MPTKICDDAFIYETFSRPFLAKFGCKTCRFPCFDMGVADMESTSEEEDKESPSVWHRDDNNGQEEGNATSVTFSRFF